ncbi:MAG: BLUF domain-containing protein [Gemmatimonadales bacterium]
MSSVLQIVYVSTATVRWTAAALLELLHASRRKNQLHGVTGLLGHNDGTFLQLVEGPAAQVRLLLDRIRQDPRHEDVSVLVERAVPHRYFPDWSMGFQEVEEVIPGPGLSPVLPLAGAAAKWVADPGLALAFFESCRPVRSAQTSD